MLAVKFGEKHGLGKAATEWRRSLSPGATQADAYLACERGDWLFWQLKQLPKKQYKQLRPAIKRSVESIVARAIRRAVKHLRGNRKSWVGEYRRWARCWLSGEDRSSASAWAVVVMLLGKRQMIAVRAAWAAHAAADEDGKSTAMHAVDSAAWVTEKVGAVEQRLQVRDIRREIPTWPGM